jgi:FdhD protein
MNHIEPTSPAVRAVEVQRGGGASQTDLVAVESPLDVRLNGEPFAVIMRTPGADRDLALGFLHSEGLVRRAADVTRVDQDGDIVNVVFARERGDAVAAALASARHVTATAACGVCGRRDLDRLAGETAMPVAWLVSAGVISSLPVSLGATQSAFAQTGGLHAAGLFDLDGRLDSSAEDIGRHNAVDKIVGAMLDQGQVPLSNHMMLVSGRSSFEIVQKAWRAGIPLVASVSAPSSLAVDIARQAGMTLVGFVRDGRFNIYTHPARVEYGVDLS